MKYVLNESQANEISKQLIKMSENVGYYETLSRFKLPLSAAKIFLKPKNRNNFSCQELTEIMFYYIFQTKDIPEVLKVGEMVITNEPYDGDGFHWNTSIVDRSGVVEFSYGYVQPFQCSNEENKIVINFRFDQYTRGNWQEPDDDYIEEDEFHVSFTYDISDIEFKTLDQAISWYMNEYPKIVKMSAKEYFKRAKSYNEEHS
jgi:hypothetical protein